MKDSLKQLLPFFNVGVALIIVTLIIAMIRAYMQMIKKRPDKYRTKEVFEALRAEGIFTRKKLVLSLRERPMYAQLVRAFPGHVILAQVSFNALLETDDRATRNRYERKIADFVICTKAFGAIAIVELDDSSHDGREKADAVRDSFLTAAGYPVFRYRTIPEISRLHQDITPEAAKFDDDKPPVNVAIW
ncbi:MAG: DUF2726 domain-containing protein [Undibacterium umbellatum]|uniref:DUF2726 domain-containing protein n=1 Tax=Undibacterium umbellatum TaxID=2762300 RepID=UPI003BB74993